METTIQGTIHSKRILNFVEACQLTGLSESFMRKLCHWKTIPHSKPNGKLVFFDRLKLEDWLLSNPVQTQEEQQIQAAIISTTQAKKKRGSHA